MNKDEEGGRKRLERVHGASQTLTEANECRLNTGFWGRGLISLSATLYRGPPGLRSSCQSPPGSGLV